MYNIHIYVIYVSRGYIQDGLLCLFNGFRASGICTPISCEIAASSQQNLRPLNSLAPPGSIVPRGLSRSVNWERVVPKAEFRFPVSLTADQKRSILGSETKQSWYWHSQGNAFPLLPDFQLSSRYINCEISGKLATANTTVWYTTMLSCVPNSAGNRSGKA